MRKDGFLGAGGDSTLFLGPPRYAPSNRTGIHSVQWVFPMQTCSGNSGFSTDLF